MRKLRFSIHKDDILQLGIKLWWEEASLLFFLPCLFIVIYWRKDDPGIMGDE